jgi:ethanolamine-phosphate cytidylyltransferase
MDADAILNAFISYLARLGIPRDQLPSSEQSIVGLVMVLITSLVLFLIFGRRQRSKQRHLKERLEEALEAIDRLEEELLVQEHEESEQLKQQNKQIRVWMDGAFDMFHYGHMNAFRQGRALGTYLVVGVNDDESIKACKGTAPVLNDDERIGAVSGCRWVDEIVPHCPYVMTPEYLSEVIKKYKIDYVVHGDDPCIVDGKDVYQDAKDRGIYREIPRTTGVSTTDIVGRMLVFSRDHHDRSRQSPVMGSLMSKSKKRRNSTNANGVANGTEQIKRITSADQFEEIIETTTTSKIDYVSSRSKFLTTGRMIRIFSQQCREPKPEDKIVYIDGAFDMFHVGHVETLKKARSMGDFLIVGIHNDDMVNHHRGSNYPIMNLNERVLSVLGCRYADDVLIDAPWEITKEMIAALNISLVVTGTKRDYTEPKSVNDRYYQVPKQLGILQTIQSQSPLTVETVVERILAQEASYRSKLKKKSAAENAYYSNRYGFEVKDAVAGASEGDGALIVPEMSL